MAGTPRVRITLVVVMVIVMGGFVGLCKMQSREDPKSRLRYCKRPRTHDLEACLCSEHLCGPLLDGAETNFQNRHILREPSDA